MIFLYIVFVPYSGIKIFVVIHFNKVENMNVNIQKIRDDFDNYLRSFF